MLFLHMLVISGYYVFPIKLLYYYHYHYYFCFVRQVDVEETWMNGLRKEPLNVSVNRDEERSALA